MNYQEIRNIIVKGLHDYLLCDVVPTDTIDKRPSYPYLSYKFTSLNIPQGSHNMIRDVVPSGTSDFEFNIEYTKEEQPKMVISVNSYSNDEIESYEMALRARDWFEFYGYYYLKNNGIVVNSIGNVQDRTVLIVDDYEKRQGFDVTIRISISIKMAIETMENISIRRD